MRGVKKVTLVVTRKRDKVTVTEEYVIGQSGLDADLNPNVAEYDAAGRLRRTRRATARELAVYQESKPDAVVAFGPDRALAPVTLAQTYHPVMSDRMSSFEQSGRRIIPSLFS